jgi:hypothetical protein
MLSDDFSAANTTLPNKKQVRKRAQSVGNVSIPVALTILARYLIYHLIIWKKVRFTEKYYSTYTRC